MELFEFQTLEASYIGQSCYVRRSQILGMFPLFFFLQQFFCKMFLNPADVPNLD